MAQGSIPLTFIHHFGGTTVHIQGDKGSDKKLDGAVDGDGDDEDDDGDEDGR